MRGMNAYIMEREFLKTCKLGKKGAKYSYLKQKLSPYELDTKRANGSSSVPDPSRQNLELSV